MENKIFQVLYEFGLSKNETKVYIEAVKHKEISPYKLSKLVHIPRTTVYEVMMSLSLKGLITIKTSQGLEKQQTWIVAKNPSILREILQKKHADLVKLEVDIIDILPQLKTNYLSHQENADFQFLPGVNGAKKVFQTIDNVAGRVQIYLWDHQMPVDTLGRKFIDQEVNRAIISQPRKYRTKTIIPLNNWTKHVLTYQYGRDHRYIEYHEFRFIENLIFNLYQDIYLFSNRIAIVMAKDDEIWGLIIKSPLLYKSFRSIFEFMWQQATPVTKKFVKSLGENEFLKQELKKKSTRRR